MLVAEVTFMYKKRTFKEMSNLIAETIVAYHLREFLIEIVLTQEIYTAGDMSPSETANQVALLEREYAGKIVGSLV